MPDTFDDQVALVTGASQGIGLATARAFADAGVAVALADIDEDAVRAAADALAGAGHRTVAIRCNVADESGVAQTIAAFGRLDAA